MTHPTLGYSNFRFADGQLVHMPSMPTATLTVACDAVGPADEPLPHDVDAAVTCPNCRRALVADWWMALMENERRTGDVSSLSGTLDDISNAAARLLSQTDAVVEETMLGGGASMIEQPRPQPAEVDGGARWHGVDWTDLERVAPDIPAVLRLANQTAEAQQAFQQGLINTASPVTIDVTDSQELNDAMESLARQLASSPLADLKRRQIRGEWTMDVPPSLAQDVPLADPGAERVRKMLDAGVAKMRELPESATLSDQVRAAVDAADEFLAEHPFETCHRCNYDTHRCPGCGTPLRHGTEVCDDCNAMHDIDEVEFTHGGTVVDDRDEHDYPDQNWCHVHNRVALQGRETCSECEAIGHD